MVTTSKVKTEPYFTPYTETKSRWSKDLELKGQTFRRKKRRLSLQPECSKAFLKIHKVQTVEEEDGCILPR